MRARSRYMRSGLCGVVVAIVTFAVAGCSKPEEVISSRIAVANKNLEAGRAAEAVQILEKLDRAHPDQPAVLEALGFAHAQNGQHRQAANCFVRAADRDPNSASLRQMAAEAFLRDGALDLAAEQHRMFLHEFPGDYQSWQKLGEIEEQRGDLLRAIDAYLEWYRIRPGGEGAFRLGTAFRRLNNSPQAKIWFEATVRQGEDHLEEALLALLELEIEAGDFAAAERTAGQIDRNYPGSLDASPLAGVRARIAAWKEAEKSLAEARAEQERLARELEETRRQQQAELARSRQVLAASERPPEAPTAGAFPGPSGAAQPANPAQQAAARATLASISPSVAAAIERRESGQVDKAVEILWRALGADDSRVEIWAELADCYRELKQYSPAEACILEARRRAPDSIEIETAFLNIVRESQERDVYFARLEEARRRFPANANLAYVLARELVSAAGDPARAVVAYEDFLLLADPSDPRRTEATEFIAQARRR
jgi:tetratricopeptide (TPR) repeat protein